MHRSTVSSAVLLGIVAVYGIGVYPIVLEEHIDWAESAVALGSLIQVIATLVECPIRVLAFLGAASCFVLTTNPVLSYFMASACYGSFYASFLNKVERPETVLKVEFLGELAFLPLAAVCLLYFQSLDLVILVSGGLWWFLSDDWTPEVLEPSKGTNKLFIAAWMCASAVMSGLLLFAVFIVAYTFDQEDEPKAVCVALLVIMFFGCITAVALDSKPWYPTVLLGLLELTLANVGMLTLGAEVLSMVAVAASIGSGISAVMVGVRKAYGGSYSTLLAMQKLSELLPAVLLASAGSDVTGWIMVVLCGVSGLLFSIVRDKEARITLWRMRRDRDTYANAHGTLDETNPDDIY